MHFSLILLALFSTEIHAGIFGPDDRVDTKFASGEAQELAKSVPALIQHHRLKALPDGRFELHGNPMTTKMGLCAEEAFAEESNIANCSASFIGKDKILTAAHCLDEGAYACSTYSVVFDYQRNEIPMVGPHIVDQSAVYKCKEILFYKFDRTLAGIDLAVIRVDRPVEGREPIELDLNPPKKNDALTLIGYPMGISQKVVEEGKVTSTNPKNVSFRHDLDSFSVNSGSPIFKNGKQVGVLARGTGGNFTYGPGQKCSQWYVGSEKDWGEGNDLSSLKDLGL